MTVKHKPFFSLLLLLSLSSLTRSLHLSAWLGWCSRGPGSIVQFHTCLLYWHLSEHIFPLNISPHIILHFLYNDMLSLISLCKPSLARGSEYNNGLFYLARHQLYFNTCHKVHFGNWSGLKEKESSSSHKHLDNCLLQHEKQLEVSGSWERGGGRGRRRALVGQRSVLSVRREKGQREVKGGGWAQR